MTEPTPITEGLPDDLTARLKRIFFVPLMLTTLGVLIAGIVGLVGGGVANWWGPVVAASGMLLVLTTIMLSRFRTVSAAPAVVLAIVGTGIGFAGAVAPGIVAAVSLLFTLGYVFWYSRLGPRTASALTVGSPLPVLEFAGIGGEVVSSDEWLGSPTIVLFYRGNWCPLCNVQVKELADGYREIEERGAAVVLVSPQSAEHSSELAAKFDAPMTFLVDEGNAAARRLGIQHPGGTPVVITGFDAETVLPTAVVLDADNIVRFAHETDNYRVRPDPALFLAALDRVEVA